MKRHTTYQHKDRMTKNIMHITSRVIINKSWNINILVIEPKTILRAMTAYFHRWQFLQASFPSRPFKKYNFIGKTFLIHF